MGTLIRHVTTYVGTELEKKTLNLFIDDRGCVHFLNDEIICQLESNVEEIDGTRYVAVPSFTDLHVHFREPGFEAKETLMSGQRAAIKGGVGMVCTMPNTKPPIDRPARLADYLERIEREKGIEVLPSVAITLNQAGEVLTDLKEMKQLGAVAYTDDGRTVMSKELLGKALRVSQDTGQPVMTHSEDHQQAANFPTRPYPPEVESDIVARDIEVLKQVGGHLHIAHLSVIESLNAVIRGKSEGLNVTCEVSPHHLYFDAERLNFESAIYKVNPPLRGEKNRKMLLEGIKRNWVDAIASDHAPHEPETKLKNYQNGTYGFIGLETMFGVCNTVFMSEGISFESLVKMMSFNPRKILNQPLNAIEEGKNADLLLIDLNETWEVSLKEIESKSQNSPWIGKTLIGRVAYYFKDKNCLLKKGEVQWPFKN